MNHDELVRKMKEAAVETSGNPDWIDNAMTAVLRVCVKELLREPVGEEPFSRNVMVCNFLKCRREDYQPPKPKTPEERVTIETWIHCPSRFTVLLDGWNPGNHDGFKDRKDAERYRLGLIAELKEQAK